MWEGSFSKGQELMSIPRPDPQATAWSLFVTLLPRAVFICSGDHSKDRPLCADSRPGTP